MSLTNSHSQLLSHGEVFMFIIWLLDQPLDHDEPCFTLSRENNGSRHRQTEMEKQTEIYQQTKKLESPKNCFTKEA